MHGPALDEWFQREASMHCLLTEDDVAKQLHVSVASLRRWRMLHRGPQFIKVGALVRYRPEDLDLWLAALPTGGVRPEHKEARLEAAQRSA